MATVGKIKAEYDATPYDLRPREILIDIIGVGAGVYDRCKEIGLPVRGINVGEAASSRENCARLRDELWFKGREWFQDKACSMPQDDGLIAELTAPTYAFTSTGKMLVESKADMKKRGMRSPDLADAFLLTFDLLEGRRLRRYSERARYAFLGVPFDEGNIGKPGSEEGPREFRLASQEYFTYWVRVQHRSVRNRRRLRRRFHAQGQPGCRARQIYRAVREVLKAGLVPILVGGDRSLSIAATKALSDHIGVKKKMGYLHFGAHLDLADSWAGEKNLAPCALARITELPNSQPATSRISEPAIR